MFDLLMKLLCSIATFLFPVFASYKALKANDPAQVTPWLMYWVVIACVLVVESWTEWLLCWLPFYYNIRTCFMFWLVLPQTQGATKLYLEQVHPALTKHELEIEDWIARVHDQLKALGMEYLKRAIAHAEEVIFGIRRSEAPPSPTGDPNQPISYANALLSRFRLPPISPYGSQVATDFYHALSSTLLQQAPTTKASSGDDWHSVASKVLPQTLKGKDEKAEYIEAQKKRLAQVMAALDKEMTQLKEVEANNPPTTSPQTGAVDLQKSPSQATLSGDFDHVDKAEAEEGAWWTSTWGNWEKQGPVETAVKS